MDASQNGDSQIDSDRPRGPPRMSRPAGGQKLLAAAQPPPMLVCFSPGLKQTRTKTNKHGGAGPRPFEQDNRQMRSLTVRSQPRNGRNVPLNKAVIQRSPRPSQRLSRDQWLFAMILNLMTCCRVDFSRGSFDEKRDSPHERAQTAGGAAVAELLPPCDSSGQLE